MTDQPGPRRIEGSCHCGNIRFLFEWPGGPTIPVRACGCMLCRKHAAVWTSHPEGSFAIAIEDESRLNRYRFGTRTADFHVCRTCGVIPITTSEIDGALYAVVNVKTFDDVDQAELDKSPTDFEGEAVDDRLARRKHNWTPQAATSSDAGESMN